MSFLYLISLEEFLRWLKQGRRSEMSDLVAILFFFFLIFFFTKDILTSIVGAFSIYLWFGTLELKDYPVLNKLLIISLVTYNLLFISGLISNYLQNPFIFNTSFSFSFWVILGLGFILFGRKYIVIWRFMSPEYLTLLLYIVAWLAVVFVNQYTPINLLNQSPLAIASFNPINLLLNIYFILIVVNWLIYFASGPILDKLLGIKTIKDEELIKMINQVKINMGIKKRVKLGIGNYPILNAMAYGSFLDRRIALIMDKDAKIPHDELKGIVAHEFAHSKNNHTLILTTITSIDLIVRMIVGFPATFYDYTFGNPHIPFFSFIVINIGIYMLIYIFVRFLEGKADLYAKKNGYGKELVKALYNLECFYATGRDIGLNTMLLCEEKINHEHQILNFIDTAEFIYSSMIKPKRLSFLSNFLNSHPPTHHRVAAILGNNLSPSKEALLPFICLKKSKIREYGIQFESARKIFKQIATDKFSEQFKIEKLSEYSINLSRIDLFKFDLHKDYLFKNKLTNEIIFGTLRDVHFKDNVCDIDELIVHDIKNKKEITLNSSLYDKSRVFIDGLYFLDKKTPLVLKDIEIDESYENTKYIFSQEDKTVIKKKIKDIKLPNSVHILNQYNHKDLFFKDKGIIKILRCSGIKINNNYDDIEIEFKNIFSKEEKTQTSLKLKNLIIKPQNISIIIGKNKNFRDSEVNIINWLIEKESRVYLFLKKPVNNIEIGYITSIETIATDKPENNEVNTIQIRNIFSQIMSIPYKSIEVISFQYETALIQKKHNTSLFSKLGYKIQKRIKPQQIIYLNKV
jgi:Zn-dependent protease with chaperone function